ncbi:hypothetical protein UA42_00030 [Photobacterium kishitanii]|nr:hypothetical protein UA42_00030 [Photobacterium kishitanii]
MQFKVVFILLVLMLMMGCGDKTKPKKKMIFLFLKNFYLRILYQKLVQWFQFLVFISQVTLCLMVFYLYREIYGEML